MAIPDITDAPRTILSVSELTRRIKSLLEGAFEFVWITGEISNHRIPTSGHHYFTLKDKEAQISAVMFRGAARSLTFSPDDGVRITGMGRVSVYPPRGNYQIILEYMVPDGIGALQLAFEQLKSRLAAEGLFNTERKRPLPLLPRHVTLVTSPSGAVVHDFINIVNRRFANLPITVVPVKVQGDGAALEIAAALGFINRRVATDVIVICRGGGSLEDLQAFNTEVVARAVFDSRIPVVSAVGHETDYTIADFTADVRAPTPSAAAEIIVPVKTELDNTLRQTRLSLERQIRHRLEQHRRQLNALFRHLGNPRRHIIDLRLHLDDMTGRVVRSVAGMIRRQREKLQWRSRQLGVSRLQIRLTEHNQSLYDYNLNLLKNINNLLISRRQKIQATAGMLTALDPTAVLQRGYSIARNLKNGRIVRNAATLSVGDGVEVVLALGRFEAEVNRVDEK
ncbi:MAG: exodeoxyribonuclease VII large subunit [Pseudomonadota bacterium]